MTDKPPIKYIPGFIPNHQWHFDALWESLPWEQREAPRRECWFNGDGSSYTYGSGEHARTYAAHNIWAANTAALIIGTAMMTLNDDTGADYNCCFVNGYENGRQHLGWHADDSPEMDMDHPIATVSLGAAREIWFRRKNETMTRGENERHKVMLEPGSACIMALRMQHSWEHRIPKSPRGDLCGPRISLTFRRLV